MQDNQNQKLKVVHIITDLFPGGAETMLYRLLTLLQKDDIDLQVISLSSDGTIGDKLRSKNIPVQILGMKPNWINPLLVFRLAKWIRKFNPDIVQTWMYHADLVGGIASKIAGGAPVIWGIHNSNLDSKTSKWLTRWVVKLCAVLSHTIPNLVSYCSFVSKELHVKIGYKPQIMRFIPNGFDLQLFTPDPLAYQSVREELGLPDDTPIVGFLGRDDPQKDLPNLIEAASFLHQQMPEVHFVLAGMGIDNKNSTLTKWISDAKLAHCFHLLGRREDTPRLSAAFNLLVVSSAYGEAFPLVLGEAMSCEVPCVATDVGDSKLIIGETGKIVPPRDPQALANACYDILSMTVEQRSELGKAARKIIAENYSITTMANIYKIIYLELVGSVD
jgi:glycosyltransferase involved in cell wall biosynthesis